MDNVPKAQDNSIYLTPSEQEQYTAYIKKCIDSRTFAEKNVYLRKIKALAAIGKARAYMI